MPRNATPAPGTPDPGTPGPNTPNTPPARLGDADQSAINALVASGFDARKSKDPRAVHAGLLLHLLRAGPKPDPTLADITLASITSLAREDRREQTRFITQGPTLHGEDIEALDALASAHFNPGKVHADLRPRAQRAAAIGDLLRNIRTPAGGRDLLIERTMQQVVQAREQGPAILAPRAAGWRMRDVVSIAATLLMGAGVLWPIFSTVSQRRAKGACGANMGSIASALGSYSNDYAGQLPAVEPMHAGASWWNVGSDHDASNSANLFTLARKGYAGIEKLACKGNPHAVFSMPLTATDWRSSPEISYSYYVMAGPNRPAWRRSSTTVVLADRSPVALRAMAGQAITPEENSRNHEGQGQWTLRLDGSDMWMETPVVQTATGPDNIWLPITLEEALHNAKIVAAMTGARHGAVPLPTDEQANRQREIRLFGNEVPGSVEDSFVGP